MPGARSVHLWWSTPDPTAEVKADVSVDESVPGTYACAVGFNGGYMGIQEVTDTSVFAVPKVVIFSLWDSDKGQVRVVDQGENVRTVRFGGEGVGAQSVMPYDWKLGEVCSCKVQAFLTGTATRYKAWFRGSSGEWKHVATYEVEVGGRLISGIYSFVEDFVGKERQTRRAKFAVECRGTGLKLKKSHQAKFTASNSPLTNIDAYVVGPWIGLATGGDVVQKVPLGTLLEVKVDV